MRLDRRDFLKLSSCIIMAAGAGSLLRLDHGDADASPAATTSPITNNIAVRFRDGREEVMPLEEYLKGVIEGEMATGWPMESLKAQAVASRTYAVKRFNTSGFVSESGQAYKTSRHADTSAAVDATSGQVMTHKGSIILPNFFTQCNGQTTRDSEHALNWQTGEELGWNYIAYLRARPCSGHAPYTGGSGSGFKGHGVGMCQIGARDLARQGMGYQEILARYYTDIQVVSVPAYTGAQPSGDPRPSPSDGMVTVPGLVGKPEQQAKEDVLSAGLQLWPYGINYQGHDDLPDSVLRTVSVGCVLSTNPSAGMKVTRGTVVQIAVRKD